MKFLLELMSCYGSHPRASSAKEETRSLVGLVPRRRSDRVRGVKRGRSRRSASSIGEWRPSLSSIAEDNVFNEGKERGEEVVAAAGSPSGRNLKRKLVSSPKARSSSSNESDIGRIQVQAMMPVFSPAPFVL